MRYFYIAFTTPLAWTLIIVGVLCLSIAIKAKKAVDFGFSLLGLMIIVLFATPPEGIIPVDDSSQIATTLLQRVPMFIYFASIPWFLVNITSLDKKKLLVITACIALGLYLIMRINDSHDDAMILFVIVRGVAMIGILLLGVRAVAWNYKQKYSNNRVTILVALLSAYQLLFLLVILVHLTKIYSINFFMVTASSLSVWSLISLLTTLAMLLITQLERSKLERVFKISEKRLQTVMENAPMLVLELERDGSISYINDFGVMLLGYNDANEVLNMNWFNTFLLPSDIALLHKLYTKIFNGALVTATFKNTVRSKDGQEIMINWVNFMSQDQNTNVHRIICIGRDISSEETANRLVAEMQKELERENLVTAETAHFELEKNVVGKSKAFMYAVQRARQVAITHAPVLLEGETGVGKEVFANLIHMNSSRSKMPCIKVNCGALPKELIEDELFGHEKGAFTSAIQARKGRFELADNGTIFLDEIGELPLEMQPKLLRVLQNGEFERVGGQTTIKVDVRILAATNRNLLDEINHGNFREDLYYRLNVFPITIPALRNRKEDLPDLIHYFVASMSKEYHKTLEQISTADLELLLGHRWPGNIRELKNVIERAVIVSEGRVLKLDWWRESETAIESNSNQALEQIERVHIMTILEKCRWKINGENGAAEVLNMHPNTLRSKMKRLGIARPQQKGSEEVESSNTYIPSAQLEYPPQVSRSFSS